MRWGLNLLLAVLLLVPVACGSSQSEEDADRPGSTDESTPRSDGPIGRVVLEGGTGAQERLYLVNVADPFEPQPITEGPAYGPRFSHDGRTLTYVVKPSDEPEDAQVVLHVLGQAPRSIAAGRCPNFTSDNRLVIGDPDGGLAVMALDGSQERHIEADSAACADDVPASGSYVVWSQTDSLAATRDGSASSVLLTMPGCGIGPVGVNAETSELAFTAACDSPGTSGLYVADSAGAQPQQILKGEAYGAAWSPDGNWIATALQESLEKGYRLVVVRRDGTDRREIDTPGSINNPTWAPLAE